MGGGGEEKLSGRSSRACHTAYTTSMYRIRPAVLILPTVSVILTNKSKIVQEESLQPTQHFVHLITV